MNKEKKTPIIVPKAPDSEESIQLIPYCIGAVASLSRVTLISPDEKEGWASWNEASLSVVQVNWGTDVAAAPLDSIDKKTERNLWSIAECLDG